MFATPFKSAVKSLRFGGLVIVLAVMLGITAGIVLAFTPSVFVSFDLSGCNLPDNNKDGIPDYSLPIGGEFVCLDADYTSGNLGKNWNELDLVPHRLETRLGSQTNATTTYNVIVAADHKTGSATGYDVVSEPEVNTALSDASCQILNIGPQLITGAVTGGADQVIYRELEITQNKGTTCVFDYYQRLALGASLYPGSSLQSYMFERDDFSTGKRTIPLPVNEILPQDLDKTMEASRGSDHMWTIGKEPMPAYLNFTNTCDPAVDLSAPVQITVTYEKLAADPNGPVTVVTKISATNPAARTITVNVTDVIYAGTDQSTPLDTENSGDVDVPAFTTMEVFEHTFVWNTPTDGVTMLNDVATATYTDKVTGIPVPGTTTAEASAEIQNTGPVTNATAVINDVESITGTGLQFSADAFSGTSGAFDGGYTAGTPTVGPVSWTSDSVSDSGTVIFEKTVYVEKGTILSNGALSDTASVTGSNGFYAEAPASVEIDVDTEAELTINKTIPNILTGAETVTFSFTVTDSGGDVDATPSITFAAGETSKSVTVSGLDPDTYTVSEDPLAGWQDQASQDVDLTGNICSDSASFTNVVDQAAAQVKKVTDPAGEEAGWEFTLYKGADAIETVTTTGAGYAAFSSVLGEGSYSIVETEKDGWQNDGPSGDCSFTVDLPADANRTFSCTYTNTQLGRILVDKITYPAGSAQSFEFDPSYGSNFFLADGDPLNDSGYLSPGAYSVAEVNIPTGWDLTDSYCDDGSAVSSIALAPGETVTCTFENTERGQAQVIKTVQGAAPTGTQAFTFQLRQGASTTEIGTTLESLEANAANGGQITFSTLLVPGDTYQMCEVVMPGWMTNLGDFVPDSFIPPDGVVPNPNVDNSILCVNFSVEPGELVTFTVDNTPPPGGRALTIGFWKNWASCASNSGRGQDPVLDQTLALVTPPGIQVGDIYLEGDPANPDVAPDCLAAVRLLNKSDINSGKKQASDAAYNLAAQLVAAELNVAAGSYVCGDVVNAINAANMLLAANDFNGTGTYKKKLDAAETQQANTLAQFLDDYNNSRPNVCQ